MLRVIALTTALTTAFGVARARPAAAADCQGAYAEELSAASPAARTKEHDAGTYVYAVRTTATYECAWYGEGGALRTTRQPVAAYGTAFGWRRDGDDTLLVTNDHVAEWPAVTDDEHSIDGVASGCKRVDVALAIVDDDRDDYAPDDVPLEVVAADLPLDVAIVRAHAALGVMPWRLGTSATLAARDAVVVQGFPLGEFHATNVGKVIVADEHDSQGDWDHDDFVVDALLAPGGSGSPVLAVSCATGEPELVGVFHARYLGASGLNTAIAIDQLRDFLTTLAPPRRPPPREPDAAARARLADELAADPWLRLFAVGELTAAVRARPDGALVYSLYGADFPRDPRPLLVLEDLPADGAFGARGRVFARTSRGLRRLTLDDDERGELATLIGLVRRDAITAFDDRALARTPPGSRDEAARSGDRARKLARQLDAQHDAAPLARDVVGRADEHAEGDAVTLESIGAR